MIFFYLSLLSLVVWLVIFLLPWRPWQTNESWDVSNHHAEADLSDFTVLIPARNEETVIKRTLKALQKQGRGLNIIIINDNSTDGTAGAVRQYSGQHLKLIESGERPAEWTGKLWALEQGRRQVQTPFLMLLDADILLQPGLVAGLRKKLITQNKDFVSLMAMPTLTSFWQKLIMPAFIYFFKLLYPFSVANSKSKWVSAAAGGCVLTKTAVLDKIGGFSPLKDALIDDCTLAGKVEEQGYRTWLGLTHSAISIRPDTGFPELWDMVARTAYTQLRHSVVLLLLCTAFMILIYWMPVVGLFIFFRATFAIAVLAILVMLATFLPILRYYRLSRGWAVTFPIAATLFLAMTWTSAIRYWKGERLRWRGRIVKTKN